MTILSVNEMAVPQPLEYTKDANTYTRQFKVELDPALTTPGLAAAIEASTATGIPKVGDELTVAGNYSEVGAVAAFCNSVIPNLQSPLTDFYHYIVTCTYDQSGLEASPSGNGSTDNAFTLSYSYDKSEATVWFDVDGKGILNSVGDPFNDPLRVTVPVLSINITDTVSTYNPHEALDNLHTINKEGVSIAGVTYKKRTLMLTEYSAIRGIRGGGIVWNRTIKLTAAALPFSKDYKILIMDRGFNYLPLTTANTQGATVAVEKKRPIKIGTNKDKSSTAQCLDGTGGILGDGLEPKFIKFNIFEEANWGPLNIPSLTGVPEDAP